MSPKDTTISIRVESTLKVDVEKIFKKLGLTNSEAISLFFKMVKLNKGLPFEIKIPSKKTSDPFEQTNAVEDLENPYLMKIRERIKY